MKPLSICIDAGHGGHDSGAVGPTGKREKDTALAVTLLLGTALLAAGMQVFYTRKEDKFLELPERAAIANNLGVDLFLSIHCNSASSPARGFEVFTTPGQTASDAFATELFKAYAAEFPALPKRMDMRDGDPDKEASFAVLRRSRMPAALFELDFIHTAQGEEFLDNPVMRARMAQALASGVLAYRRQTQPTVASLPNVSHEMRRLAQEILNLADRA